MIQNQAAIDRPPRWNVADLFVRKGIWGTVSGIMCKNRQEKTSIGMSHQFTMRVTPALIVHFEI